LFYRNYDSNQFGFRPRSSTQCALLAFQSHVLKAFESKPPLSTFAISFDLQKAFDTINHDVLITILTELHFPTYLIKLFQNYLFSRKQIVFANNCYSEPLPITSGIPQGSVLGPVLFCLYINSLQPTCQEISCIKYADDTTFIISVPHSVDPVPLINKEITHMQEWCLKHKMKLNNQKTKIMQLDTPKNYLYSNHYITNFNLFIAEQFSFLGYTISKNLSWNSHIDHILRKLASRIHVLRVLKNTLTQKQLIQVYAAYFQSYFDSLFPFFSNLSEKDISKIDSITKRAHRIICNSECKANCLPDTRLRCKNLAGNLFNSISANNSHLLKPLLPERSFRSSRFLIPAIKSNKYLNSFFVQGAINYNRDLNT
jgi:hypothetical protein